MPHELYLAFLLVCFIAVLIPGPTATLIIANSLAHGTRAGLLNVAGTQLGLAVMIGIVAIGLASVIEILGTWFDWIRLAGAAYLIWIGWKMVRSAGAVDASGRAPTPRGGFFLQGFLVALSNPKMLLYFGALIPQFIDPAGDYLSQILLLGLTSMVFAVFSDGLYAMLSGRAGRVLSQKRVRLISRIGGGFLIGGGIWLALQRR